MERRILMRGSLPVKFFSIGSREREVPKNRSFFRIKEAFFERQEIISYITLILLF